MARLWSTGFELQSVTNAVEWDTTSGSPTISTSIFNGGLASLRCNTVATTAHAQNKVSAGVNNLFCRFYVYIASLPSATCEIFDIISATGTYLIGIRMTTSGALQLYDFVSSAQRGSDSSALSTATWYRVEVNLNGGGATCTAKIDGTQFATGSAPSASDIATVDIGVQSGVTTDLYFDDLAVNDASGSFQTSYPDVGKITHLKPNAAGDANAFATQTGGTAGSTNNFTRVQETTPDDATSFNGSATLNAEDLYNCDASGLTGGDTINVVAVGVRFRKNGAAGGSTAAIEIEKTTGGTKSSSAGITPSSTTWRTNTNATPTIYPLTTYQDPDSSNWTSSTLDTMQIGAKITASASSRVDISTIWALVDYVPGAAPANTVKTLAALGAG